MSGAWDSSWSAPEAVSLSPVANDRLPVDSRGSKSAGGLPVMVWRDAASGKGPIPRRPRPPALPSQDDPVTEDRPSRTILRKRLPTKLDRASKTARDRRRGGHG